MEEEIKQQVKYCTQHKQYQIEFFCIDETCLNEQKEVCAKCHLTGDHANHKFIDQQQFLDKNQEIGNQCQEKLIQLKEKSPIKQFVKEKTESLKQKTIDQLNQLEQTILHNIENNFQFLSDEKLEQINSQLQPLKNNLEKSTIQQFKFAVSTYNSNGNIINNELEQEIQMQKKIQIKIGQFYEQLEKLYIYQVQTDFNQFNQDLKDVQQEKQQKQDNIQDQVNQDQNQEQKQEKEQLCQKVKQDQDEEIKQSLNYMQQYNFNLDLFKIYNFGQQLHTQKINCLIKLSNQEIASCSNDSTIKIWNYVKKDQTRILNGHAKAVYFILKVSVNELASCSMDKTIKIWNFINCQCLLTLQGHTDSLYSLARLSDQDKFIASCGAEPVIKLWNWAEGSCFGELKGHQSKIWCLLNLKSGFIASGGADQKIKVWRVMGEYDFVRDLVSHTSDVVCLEKISDQVIASGSSYNDQSIKLWNWEEGNCIKTIHGHTGPIWNVLYLGNDIIASSGYDQTIKFWNIKEEYCKKSITLQGMVCYMIQLSDTEFATGGVDNYVRVWN